MASCLFFFFNDTATTEIYTLSLHDALPISCARPAVGPGSGRRRCRPARRHGRSEEHTSELQSHSDLVCRLLLEKKKPLDYLAATALERYHKFLGSELTGEYSTGSGNKSTPP